MSLDVRERAVASLAQVDAVLEEVLDRARRPPLAVVGTVDTALVEQGAELAPRCPVGSAAEDLRDDGAELWVRHEYSVLAPLVPGRCPRGDVDAPIDHGILSCDPPVLAVAVELKLREREHDVHLHLAPGRSGVDGVDHGREDTASVVDALDGLEGVAKRPRESVELGDDNPTRGAILDAAERAHEFRSLLLRTRLVEVGVPLGDLDVAEFGPPLDLLALLGGADERRALSSAHLRDADVSVQSHSPSRARTSCCCARSPLPFSPPRGPGRASASRSCWR